MLCNSFENFNYEKQILATSNVTELIYLIVPQILQFDFEKIKLKCNTQIVQFQGKKTVT